MPNNANAKPPYKTAEYKALNLADPALSAVAERIFATLSPRMVQQIRDEAEARGKVSAKDADAAYAAMVTSIRDLEAAGEIILKQEAEGGADAE